MKVKEIQVALAKAGFDPGPDDGIRGRKMIAAIKAFQAANGLVVDGLAGPNTLAKLFPNGRPEDERFDIPSDLPWLQEARNLIGTRERRGAGSNEVIMEWAEDLELTSYGDDDIPWCGLFVAHCVGSQLPEEPLPIEPLGSRNWQTLGRETKPRLGAIMVFWRGKPTGWQGHVGFYWAEDNEAFHILGGNQSNSVNIMRISKNRLLAARWPATATLGPGEIRIAEVGIRLLSSNEA